MKTLDYVYLVPEGQKPFVDGLVANRIYKVIDQGPDWFLVRANGRSQYLDSRDCRASNYQDYITQDNPQVDDYQDSFVSSMDFFDEL